MIYSFIKDNFLHIKNIQYFDFHSITTWFIARTKKSFLQQTTKNRNFDAISVITRDVYNLQAHETCMDLIY